MRTTLATLAAIAALAAGLQVAFAADPKPEPCGGTFSTKDPAGDQGFKEEGATIVPMPASTDIVGLFFRLDGAKVTANIVISDLNTTPPSGFTAVRYRAYATVDGTVHYVQALVSAASTSYSYGTAIDAVATSLYGRDGDTTGALFPGKNGVVQIVIPPAIGGKPGTKLSATSSSVGAISAPVPEQAQLPPFYLQADTAPDGAAAGATVTPAPCEAAATPAPGANKAATKVSLTLKPSAQSAKKANAKHSASVVLKSSGPLTSLSAQLKRGKAVGGSGKLVKIDGTATLKLKLKGKIKKGAYTLAVSAKRADGGKLAKTFSVKFGA